MTTTYFNDFLTAARSAQEVFGVSFQVEGKTYRGVRSDLSALDSLVPGGFMADYKMALEVVSADVDPAIGSIITVDGIRLRVGHKSESTEDPCTVLYLQGINK